MEILHADKLNVKNSDLEQFSLDILMGLSSSPKDISAKYFYDEKGSELFQKITQHDDYYPTNKEFEILEKEKSNIVNSISGDEVDVIELGVGDGHKSKIIIDELIKVGKKVHFYPIDISEKAMHLLKENFPGNNENLIINGVVGEYFDGIDLVAERSKNTKLVLFLGSNIGNFNRVQNQGFLRRLWKCLSHGDLALIGFDLKKSTSVLNKAYNDSAGLTRDFNLNLLTRINRELGAEFKLDKFEHFGSYNPILGAMESYLLSREDQDVYIEELERSFHFSAFEPIHLEYSFKFLDSDIRYLSEKTGFEVMEQFTDDKSYFMNSLWKVKKTKSNDK